MKKRLLTVVLTLVMTLGACLTCFAADSISADEQKILDRLNAGVTLSNKTVVKLGATDLAKAEKYLKDNDLTADQVTNTLAKVEEAQATIKADTKITDLTTLKAQVKEDTTLAASLTASIQAAAKAAGTEVAVDLSTGAVTVAGETVAETPTKQTGYSYATTVAAAFAVVAVLGGCVVLARKNDLFAQA